MDPRERSNRTEAAVQRSVRKLEEDGGPARGKQTGEPVAQGIPRNFACFLEAGFRIGTQAKCFPTCRVPSGVLVFQPNRKSPSTGVTCEGKLQMKPETPPCFQKHIHTHKYVCLLEIGDPIQVIVSCWFQFNTSPQMYTHRLCPKELEQSSIAAKRQCSAMEAPRASGTDIAGVTFLTKFKWLSYVPLGVPCPSHMSCIPF